MNAASRKAVVVLAVFLAAPVTLALLPATGARADSAEGEAFCERQQGLMKTACKDALELMTHPPEESAAEISVTATAGEQGLLLDYHSGTAEDIECRHPGPLVLPKGVSVRLTVTSQDHIYEWNIPELAITETMIPGRINEVRIPTAKLGRFQGQIKRDGGGVLEEAGAGVRILAPEEYLSWQAAEEVKSCF